MPSGPKFLHELFMDDGNAIEQLRVLGYRFNRGVIMAPPGRTTEYASEILALDYLWLEWDYGTTSEVMLLIEDHRPVVIEFLPVEVDYQINDFLNEWNAAVYRMIGLR